MSRKVKKPQNIDKKNNKLIIMWKGENFLGAHPYASERESIKNVKCPDHANDILARRNKTNIEFAVWNGIEIYKRPAA